MEEEQEETKAPPNFGPVLVFSCRHIFHKRCLDQSEDLNDEANTALTGGPGDMLESPRLVCPVCV